MRYIERSIQQLCFEFEWVCIYFREISLPHYTFIQYEENCIKLTRTLSVFISTQSSLSPIAFHAPTPDLISDSSLSHSAKLRWSGRVPGPLG